MTSWATLNKETASLISNLDAYVTANLLDYNFTNPTEMPMVSLGDVETLNENVPSIKDFFDDLGLTVKTIGLFTVYPVEVSANWPEPFVFIPFRNFSGMNFILNDVNEDANLNILPNGTNYYFADDTTVIESSPFEDDTVYLVNTKVTHSFAYSDGAPDMPSEFGGFLLIGVNEDLSSYFE